MVRQRAKKGRYVAAFVITAVIFGIGLMLGIIIEGERTEYLTEAYRAQSMEYNSIQLQYQLIEQITREQDCEALKLTFEQNLNDLENARLRIERFQQDATIHEDEFLRLSREYTQAQIRYYLLAQRNQEICGEDAATVLFFRTDSECPRCDDQAFVLTYLKRVMEENLLVFSFNERLADSEPAVRLLMNQHGITEFPSIVVNGNTTSGFVSRENLTTTLCSWFDEEHGFCT